MAQPGQTQITTGGTMIQSIRATDLDEGMVLALPMGRTATIKFAKIGLKFVTFSTEYGMSRVEKRRGKS